MADVYSTTETLTHKVWLGYPVYRKVIDFGALANNATKDVNHNITGLSVVTAIYGVATNGTLSLPVPYVDTSNVSNQVHLSANTTVVESTTKSDWSAFSAKIVLEYTKS